MLVQTNSIQEGYKKGEKEIDPKKGLYLLKRCVCVFEMAPRWSSPRLAFAGLFIQ